MPSAPEGPRGLRFVQTAISPLALLVLGNAFEQMDTSELWPQGIGNVNLRISELPQQKIAQPHLAAGANHQIRIREMASVEVLRDEVFVDFKMFHSAVVRCRV